ncbi:MAG: type II toxin-antitoxin system VapC family toxin [Acidobacteriia bacterium]|nr:type II toxin-antitoxin system VapC family toxin [Terriglobia bacterium]
MALYYLETSALVKLYVREPGTDQLLRLTRREHDHRFAVLAITPVEFRSAIRRRQRMGDFSPLAAGELIGRLTQHLDVKFLCQAINDAVLYTAAGLIDRHPLRAYDAIQLAGCLVLATSAGKEKPVFVCADIELLRAAESERLPSLNPTIP